MDDLPPKFLTRMEKFLGDEFPAFQAALTTAAESGLRVNSLKISPKFFFDISPFEIEPLPWSGLGFRLNMEVKNPARPGKHPFHAAGLYYLQEPSAMLAAEILSPLPGERVLDLCAAPGGKATHLASLLAGEGLLIANDVHPQRVWHLSENLERWGICNAIVLNETPERLAEHFGAYFDKVLVDAPCSGEGLFRKEPLVRQIWTPEMPDGCAIRQLRILETAARMVKPGGRIVYSTCTFNPQENEAVIARFIDGNPDFELVDPGIIPGTTRARPEWVSERSVSSLNRALRIWPHLAPGEGHFVALLEKHREDKPLLLRCFKKRALPHPAKSALGNFIASTLPSWSFGFNFHLEGPNVYLISERSPDLEGLRVIHPGWWFGSLKKDRFEPSHALAMGITSEIVSDTLDIRIEDSEGIASYLRGERLYDRTNQREKTQKRWVLITVEGFPLGWGRRVGEIIKNYYPRRLRRST